MKKFWIATKDAFATFLHVPGTVTRSGAHVRDGVDLKRIMIIVVISLVPAALFGMWNVGYQHQLAIGGGTALQILPNFWFGFLKVLPLYIVSYVVGLFIEFFSSGLRDEEVNEGYLVTGFLIPLIVPVTTPLWMLALAVAFAVILGKEVFGGTGRNIWNPALLARAFLFFSYPSYMSGNEVWIAKKAAETFADGFTGATPLVLEGTAQYSNSILSQIIGTIPGSIGETSVIAILLGAFVLLWTGVASWKVMTGSVLGALLIGGLTDIAGISAIPFWQHLLLGGFAFGTVFMATDPVTSAQTETGKWIYGLLIGMLCIIVRLFNPGYAEGMMLAILLGNTAAPLIDHLVVSSHISRRNKKINAQA
jgi:Na+-transporting NADH:ubiquinone oxidoreductase subunit B